MPKLPRENSYLIYTMERRKRVDSQQGRTKGEPLPKLGYHKWNTQDDKIQVMSINFKIRNFKASI